MLKLKNNKKPYLNIPSFSVDSKLKDKLDNIEIFKLMNKSHFALFLGKAGSGKSSLVISFLSSKDAFKKCFHNIFLFCPANSRSSIKDDFWENNLEEEQIYDDLTIDNLIDAYSKIEQDSLLGFKSLIILDDVQKNLKGDCEKFLLHIINNRRHNRICIWICCQNYKTIPLQVRLTLTDLFIFKVGKQEIENIYEELTEIDKNKFNIITNNAYKNLGDFLYLNCLSQRLFNNWDEIIL
jgi:GTPase SAR1 family protein